MGLMGNLRGVWYFLDLRETNCKVYVGFKSKKETKDGFLVVNSSSAETELVWLRWGANDDICGEEMV
jgi:hypothetical protein